MILVSLNIVLVLVICKCDAASVNEDVKSYFMGGNKNIRDVWRKYKRGIESSLEQMLQDNYDAKSMNVYLRRSMDSFKLAEGFLEDSDPVVEVLFRDVVLMELPKMRYPKVSFPLASNLLKLDTELANVKLTAKYLVYRNASVIVYTDVMQEMMKVSPFSLAQVESTGEVTIIGEECRLSGHAIATLSEQSVNLGHNTFSLSDCKFKLEIWSPGQGAPPVFAPYFSISDGGFLQNLISKPLQEELMSKLQGGLFSFINSSQIFGDKLPKIKQSQEELFKKVNNHMTETVNNLNIITTNLNQGVVTLDPKQLEWTELEGGEMKYSVSITNTILYGLDTAFAAQTGGPEEQNGSVYVEEVIGFSSLQVRGLIRHHMIDGTKKIDMSTSSFKFSAEIQDFSVVISLNTDKDLSVADYPSSGRPAWFSPRYRTFELNHYDIDRIWSRSLLTGYITNELYTAVVQTILKGQLNDALKITSQGTTNNIKISEGKDETNSDEEKPIFKLGQKDEVKKVIKDKLKRKTKPWKRTTKHVPVFHSQEDPVDIENENEGLVEETMGAADNNNNDHNKLKRRPIVGTSRRPWTTRRTRRTTKYVPVVHSQEDPVDIENENEGLVEETMGAAENNDNDHNKLKRRPIFGTSRRPRTTRRTRRTTKYVSVVHSQEYPVDIENENEGLVEETMGAADNNDNHHNKLKRRPVVPGRWPWNTRRTRRTTKYVPVLHSQEDPVDIEDENEGLVEETMGAADNNDNDHNKLKRRPTAITRPNWRTWKRWRTTKHVPLLHDDDDNEIH